MTGHSMTERAEEVVNNVWVRLIGRVGSVITAVVGALMIPLIIGVWSWAAETGKDLDTLRSRVVVLETNSARGRADREKFQDETKDTLNEILRLVSAANERQAKIEAKVEALKDQVDRTLR